MGRLTWHPRRFEWTGSLKWKTKSSLCAWFISFRTSYTTENQGVFCGYPVLWRTVNNTSSIQINQQKCNAEHNAVCTYHNGQKVCHAHRILLQRRVQIVPWLNLVWHMKVKQWHYRLWQAPRFPGGRGSQISRQSAHEGGKAVSPTQRPPLPQGNIPGTHFC
jgi:hypothetical protein